MSTDDPKKPSNGHADDEDETEGRSDLDLPDEELEPMPNEVAELCAACVRFIKTKYLVDLDFTSDTLPLVDQYVRDSRAELAVKPESLELLQATIGAYVGEVLRREHFGIWDVDKDYTSWRVLLTRVFLSFNPIGMAREALLADHQEGWNGHLEVDPAEREKLNVRLAALPEVDEDEFFFPTTRHEVLEVAVELLRHSLRDQGLADTRFSVEDYE